MWFVLAAALIGVFLFACTKFDNPVTHKILVFCQLRISDSRVENEAKKSIIEKWKKELKKSKE